MARHERQLRPEEDDHEKHQIQLDGDEHASRRDMPRAIVGVSGRWSSKSKYIRYLSDYTRRSRATGYVRRLACRLGSDPVFYTLDLATARTAIELLLSDV